MITFLKEAWRLSREIRAKREDLEQRRTIAEIFNLRYAYKEPYNKRRPGQYLPHTGARNGETSFCQAGFAWMCPGCNKIHEALSWSVFSGLQYPACCNHPEGHRLEY